MKKFLIPLILISSPALAEPFTYAPKECEFQITFPEKPFIETKCANEGKDCTEIVTYTKAVGANSSTNFRVSCNPLSNAESDKYTPAILEETLKQMSKSAGLEPYDTQSSEDNGYKKAATLSLTERDGKALIYNGQIWAGGKSIFTLEAEMLLEAKMPNEKNNDEIKKINNTVQKTNDEIQKIFADILRGTYPKDNPPHPKASEKK